jgi:putative ABC transport system permease protein
MSFVGLIAHNLWTKRVRTILTSLAVALGVVTVVSLSVVTTSLKSSAAGILHAGKADFAVGQKHVDTLLNSTIDDAQVSRLQRTPGVAHAIGALIVLENIDADHPNFVEIGLAPESLPTFGVTILAGRPYTANANNEVMLGWRAAENLGKGVGDTVTMASGPKRVVGIFRTGQPYGDAGAMLPLTFFQGEEHRAGTVTLAFVQAAKGAKIAAVRHRIQSASPSLTTVRTESDFGQVDQTLDYLRAATTGAIALALFIGTIIVMNTMLLSFVERTREFGVLRAIGWSRGRLWGLILGEALVMSLVGAAVGVGLSFAVTALLERLPDLRGILHASFSAGDFWRALYTAGLIGILAALYPAWRAGRLNPLSALRRE